MRSGAKRCRQFLAYQIRMSGGRVLLYSILRNNASSASKNMSVTVADCPA